MLPLIIREGQLNLLCISSHSLYFPTSAYLNSYATILDRLNAKRDNEKKEQLDELTHKKCFLESEKFWKLSYPLLGINKRWKYLLRHLCWNTRESSRRSREKKLSLSARSNLMRMKFQGFCFLLRPPDHLLREENCLWSSLIENTIRIIRLIYEIRRGMGNGWIIFAFDAKHVTVRESSGWEWMSARNVRYRMKSGGVIYGLDCDADDYERGDEVISSKS